MPIAAILPAIAARDYEAFQGALPRSLPPAYDDWVALVIKWHNEYLTGDTVVREVPVKPGDFLQFYVGSPVKDDLGSLLKFAEWVAEDPHRHVLEP